MLGRDTKKLERTSKCKFTFLQRGAGVAAKNFLSVFFGCTWEW